MLMATRRAWLLIVMSGLSAAARAASDGPPSPVYTPRMSAPPVPEFQSSEARLAYLRWMGAAQVKMSEFVQDRRNRLELLQTAYYEAGRAGLRVELVLALIEVLSRFSSTAVAPNGALGLMAVNPAWTSKIGNGDVSMLLAAPVNLRYGCTVLRHYLDNTRGDVPEALTRYVENNLGLAPGNPQALALVNKTLAARDEWPPIQAGT